jgi:alkaline phosphatase
MRTSVAATSQGGATSHAYGVKVHWDSYGTDGGEPLTSLSGKPFSILTEAHEAGMGTALINSGHLAEPGTGVFASSAPSRAAVDEITLEIIEGGTDIIMGGGEILLLPEGEMGHFNMPGVRKDGLNLMERARELGYAVVYTREELFELPPETPKVLGIFAPGHTFVDRTEEELAAGGFDPYWYGAPTVAEMTRVALGLLTASDRRFLMVVEEEGSDNFANRNNAFGVLTALSRADEALGVVLDYIVEQPATLLVTTSDSEAGGPEVFPIEDVDSLVAETPLPPTTGNGGPLDGREGTGTPPFMSQPDQFGQRWPFGIAWSSIEDISGGIVAKAHGLNSELLPLNVDNTDIYRLMYATLFGVWLQ